MQTTKHAIVHQIGLNCFLLEVMIISTVMQDRWTNSDIISYRSMNKGTALKGQEMQGLQNTLYSESQKWQMSFKDIISLYWYRINSSLMKQQWLRFSLIKLNCFLCKIPYNLCKTDITLHKNVHVNPIFGCYLYNVLL